MILIAVLNPPIQLDRNSAYGADEYLPTSIARRCDIADALGVTVALHAELKTPPPDVLRRWYRPDDVTASAGEAASFRLSRTPAPTGADESERQRLAEEIAAQVVAGHGSVADPCRRAVPTSFLSPDS